MAQFSLQTFTIRKYLKKERDIEYILDQLEQLGIRALEAARLDFDLETARRLYRLCGKYRIKIGSSQLKFPVITGSYDEIVEIHRLWNCRYLAVSVLPMKYLLKKEAGIKEFAAELDKLGAKLRVDGLQLLFHHHHFEFLKYGNKTGLELLTDNTDPLNVGLVLDTYWIQRGGKTPHELIEQHMGRVKVVHLRDFKLKLSKFDLLPSDCEIGNGNLDFSKIIYTAVASDVEYMAIEQDTKDPLASIKSSVDNLKRLGFENLF